MVRFSTRITLLVLLFGWSWAAQAQVFSDDVAPILYKNCTPCHRQGGIAPFALQSYQQAVTYAFPIRNAVATRHMPPWPPDVNYRHFKGERQLTQEQIDKITAWVDNNTPRGNPANDPALPTFSDSSALPMHPEASWRIPTYTVRGSTDEYRCFVMPAGLGQGKWIKMLELLPANRKVVHHILLYADTTGTCRRLDSLEAGPGYTAVGGVGASSADLLGGWAPGSAPIQWPLNFGSRLRRSADLVMQIHYAPGSQGQHDSSSINMVFHPATAAIREVVQLPVLNHQTSLTNGPLALDSNQTKTFHARFVSFTNATILSVFPHAHMLCRNWEVYATSLTGADTTPLIKIPNWHFHWQGSYFYQKPIKITQGMALQARATYDNTANNPFNPNNPPRRVTEGEGTGDEMMLVYFAFAAYRPGDENLIIDSSILVTGNRPAAARDWEVALIGRAGGSQVAVTSSRPIRSIAVMDAGGRITYTGSGTENGLPFGGMPAGIYFVRIENSLGQRKTVRWARL